MSDAISYLQLDTLHIAGRFSNQLRTAGRQFRAFEIPKPLIFLRGKKKDKVLHLQMQIQMYNQPLV